MEFLELLKNGLSTTRNTQECLNIVELTAQKIQRKIREVEVGIY
jgi:hypothetical protein